MRKRDEPGSTAVDPRDGKAHGYSVCALPAAREALHAGLLIKLIKRLFINFRMFLSSAENR